MTKLHIIDREIPISPCHIIALERAVSDIRDGEIIEFGFCAKRRDGNLEVGYSVQEQWNFIGMIEEMKNKILKS
jgi:hypothetical protein